MPHFQGTDGPTDVNYYLISVLMSKMIEKSEISRRPLRQLSSDVIVE